MMMRTPSRGSVILLVPVSVASMVELRPADAAVSRRRGGEILRDYPDKGNGLEPGCEEGVNVRFPSDFINGISQQRSSLKCRKHVFLSLDAGNEALQCCIAANGQWAPCSSPSKRFSSHLRNLALVISIVPSERR